MSVRPKPQQDQIKARELSRGEMEKSVEAFYRIPVRRRPRHFLRQNAENILWANINLRQQRFVRHAVVAVGVIWGNVALVTPEKTNLIPRNGRHGRQQGIEPFRG